VNQSRVGPFRPEIHIRHETLFDIENFRDIDHVDAYQHLGRLPGLARPQQEIRRIEGTVLRQRIRAHQTEHYRCNSPKHRHPKTDRCNRTIMM
jgi:hypothetical protein